MEKSMFQNYTAKKNSNIVEHYESKLQDLDGKIAKKNQKIEAKKQEVDVFLEELSNKIIQAKQQKSSKEQELMKLKQSKLEALDELMQVQDEGVASEIREANKKIDNLEERIKCVQRDLEIVELKVDITMPYAFSVKDRKRLAQLLQEYDELKRNKELFSQKFSIGSEMAELGKKLQRLGEDVMRLNNPTSTGHPGSSTENIFKRSDFFNEITNPEHRHFFNSYFGEGNVLKALFTLPKDKSFAEHIDSMIQEEKAKKEARDNKPYMVQKGFR